MNVMHICVYRSRVFIYYYCHCNVNSMEVLWVNNRHANSCAAFVVLLDIVSHCHRHRHRHHRCSIGQPVLPFKIYSTLSNMLSFCVLELWNVSGAQCIALLPHTELILGKWDRKCTYMHIA